MNSPVGTRAAQAGVPHYYSWISWFQDFAHRVGHDTGRSTMTVHRLLRGDGGKRSGDVLHARLLAALTRAGVGPPIAPLGAPPFHGESAAPSTPPPTRPPYVVLDAGCGLGGTVFYLHQRLGGRYVGITLSPAQCDRATLAATERGVQGECQFSVRSYDEDLRDLLPAGVDLVVAIESLAHSPAPLGTLERLARYLRADGRMVIVDDMPNANLPDDDADLQGFRRGWLCPVVARASELQRVASRAGLSMVCEDDLTPLVPRRSARVLAWLIAVNRILRAALGRTPARVLLESMWGGLLLERLYARKAMSYRLLIFGRTDTAPAPPLSTQP